jgi:hypothetical protein
MRLSRDVRKPCLRRRQKVSTIAERTEKWDQKKEISCDQSMKLMITSPKTPKRKRKNESTHHEVEKWIEGRDWNR